MIIAVDINDVIRDNLFTFRNVYQKYVDSSFDVAIDDITDYDMLSSFPFSCKAELDRFKYEDFAYEIFGSPAACCEKAIGPLFNGWSDRVVRTLDTDEDVSVMLFSPFELPTAIQATYSFLAHNQLRAREVYFPVDSISIYDRADIVITAQPRLIAECPEGKTVVKIERPYNRDIECGHSYKSFSCVADDEEEFIINKILKKQ